MKILFILFAFLSFFCSGLVLAEDAGTSREMRENDMAENSILASLMVHRNPSSRYLCTENPYACLGADKAELALALLAAKNNKSSLLSLSKLTRFKLDAALSEDFTCAILGKGEKMAIVIRTLKPDELAALCQKEVSVVKEKNVGKFIDLDGSAVCASQREISERLSSLMTGLKKRQRCSPEDY